MHSLGWRYNDPCLLFPMFFVVPAQEWVAPSDWLCSGYTLLDLRIVQGEVAVVSVVLTRVNGYLHGICFRILLELQWLYSLKCISRYTFEIYKYVFFVWKT